MSAARVNVTLPLRRKKGERWGFVISGAHIVETVHARSAAEASGVKPGDTVEAVNGKKPSAHQPATELIRAAGDKLSLSVTRTKAADKRPREAPKEQLAKEPAAAPAAKRPRAAEPAAAKPRAPSVLYRVECQLGTAYSKTERHVVGVYSTLAIAARNARRALVEYSPWGSDTLTFDSREHELAYNEPKVDNFASPPRNGLMFRFQHVSGEFIAMYTEEIRLEDVDKAWVMPSADGAREFEDGEGSDHADSDSEGYNCYGLASKVGRI